MRIRARRRGLLLNIDRKGRMRCPAAVGLEPLPPQPAPSGSIGEKTSADEPKEPESTSLSSPVRLDKNWCACPLHGHLRATGLYRTESSAVHGKPNHAWMHGRKMPAGPGRLWELGGVHSASTVSELQLCNTSAARPSPQGLAGAHRGRY